MSIAFPVCPQRGCRGSHALRGDAAHPGKAHPSVDRLHAVVKTLAETPHLVNYPLKTATGQMLHLGIESPYGTSADLFNKLTGIAPSSHCLHETLNRIGTLSPIEEVILLIGVEY